MLKILYVAWLISASQLLVLNGKENKKQNNNQKKKKKHPNKQT